MAGGLLLAGAIILAIAVLPRRIAVSLDAGVRDEAVASVGEGYSVSTTLVAVGLVPGDGLLGRFGLPAWEATYAVDVRCADSPAFEQVAVASRRFGPGAEPVMGGLHDWTLFRSLREWDETRRRSYLDYVARGLSNPEVNLVSRFDLGWPGAWWIDDRRLLEIGQDRGFSGRDLAWTEYRTDRDSAGADHGELLGFDTKAERWVLLAEQLPPETGEIVAVP